MVWNQNSVMSLCECNLLTPTFVLPDTIVENHLEEGSQKQTDSSDSDDGSSQRVETEPTGNSVVVLAPCDSSSEYNIIKVVAVPLFPNT